MRILNKEQLTSHGNAVGRKTVAELLDVGLDSIDPYLRVKRFLSLDGDVLRINNEGFEMNGDPHSGALSFALGNYDNIYVIGAAKGVQQVGKAFEEVLGEKLTGGHLIAKHGEEVICKKIGVTLAGHPVPDEYCVKGCREIERIIKKVTPKDLVFTVTGSGVGSLMTYPAEGVSVKDVSEFTRLMQIEKGVQTIELNPIRTHLDRFKGGRISRSLYKTGATVVHLTTADPSKKDTPVERYDYFGFLAENTFLPTLASGSTYEDCIKIIKKHDAWEQTPDSIKRRLLGGTKATENVSVEEFETFGQRFFGLVFKDGTIYPAVKSKAKEMGYICLCLSEYTCAEAKDAGSVAASIALNTERMGEPFKPPIVLMSSGENIVTVGKEKGVGGRNQEYCVQAALKIAGSKKIVIGAVDTDGTDGPGGLNVEGAPYCLAGAIVDGETVEEAKKLNVDLSGALKTHGTSEPLWKLGCGVSATANVSALDLRIILVME